MELALNPFGLLLFEAEPEDDHQSHIALDEDVTPKPEKALICSKCSAPITREQARMDVNGSHEHSFFNPHGIVFMIGCFSEAPGCKPMSQPSSDFTWFPGYHWRICACYQCSTHLGWDFGQAGVTMFYGLILDRLATGSD